MNIEIIRLKILKSIKWLSSGTIGTLINDTNYENIDKTVEAFYKFVSNMKITKDMDWQEAWGIFQKSKDNKGSVNNMERLVKLIVNKNEGATKIVYRTLVNTVEKTIKYIALDEKKFVTGNGAIKDITHLYKGSNEGKLDFEYDFMYGICANKKQMIFDILENPENKKRKSITVIRATQSLQKHSMEALEKYNKDREERIELVKKIKSDTNNKTLLRNVLDIMENRAAEYPKEIIELCKEKIKQIEVQVKQKEHYINTKKKEGEMIRNIRGGEKISVLKKMLGYFNGQKYFNYHTINNDLDLKEQINKEELLIPTLTYLNTMVELDEFSIKVNNIIHKHGEYPHYIIKILQEHDYEVEIKTTGNTYNYETNLENDLQYTIFSCKDCYDLEEYYLLLKIHCGGDIRTGYSPMVCFKIADMDYFFNGMNITGYVESKDIDFEDSYEILEECKFKEGNWWYGDSLVRLHTTALGF